MSTGKLSTNEPIRLARRYDLTKYSRYTSAITRAGRIAFRRHRRRPDINKGVSMEILELQAIEIIDDTAPSAAVTSCSSCNFMSC